MRIAGRPFGVFALAALATAGGLWALAGLAGLHPVPEYAIRGANIPAGAIEVLTGGWAIMALAAAALRLALLVVSAFYLNGREVRDLLLPTTEAVDVVPLAPPEGGHR